MAARANRDSRLKDDRRDMPWQIKRVLKVNNRFFNWMILPPFTFR